MSYIVVFAFTQIPRNHNNFYSQSFNKPGKWMWNHHAQSDQCSTESM